ncbi:MAG: ubiquitin-like small modifier protein 1 [Terriglobales bacterium]
MCPDKSDRVKVNLGEGLWHHLSMPKIHIPTPLRQYAGKQPAVDVKGSTVAEALSGLVSQHPDLRRHLYTEEGKLRAFVNVYVNDEDVRYLQKEATAVSDGDDISIVPSIAGGAALSR